MFKYIYKNPEQIYINHNNTVNCIGIYIYIKIYLQGTNTFYIPTNCKLKCYLARLC